MEFLKEETGTVLTAWASNTPTCLLLVGPEGQILWANSSSEKWFGYTQTELKRHGMLRLSVDDDDLQAEQISMQEVIEGSRQSYSVRKRMTPKNDPPHWGEMSAVRYPQVGDFRFFMCSWAPIKHSSTLALEETRVALAEFTAVIKTLSENHQELRTAVLSDQNLTKHQKFLLM